MVEPCTVLALINGSLITTAVISNNVPRAVSALWKWIREKILKERCIIISIHTTPSPIMDRYLRFFNHQFQKLSAEDQFKVLGSRLSFTRLHGTEVEVFNLPLRSIKITLEKVSINMVNGVMEPDEIKFHTRAGRKSIKEGKFQFEVELLWDSASSYFMGFKLWTIYSRKPLFTPQESYHILTNFKNQIAGWNDLDYEPFRKARAAANATQMKQAGEGETELAPLLYLG